MKSWRSPKISEPFNGRDQRDPRYPGQTLFFTRRVFGTQQEIDNVFVSGFTSSSQAANCSQTDLPDIDPDTGLPYAGDYFCQQALVDERERILLDTQPPSFSLA